VETVGGPERSALSERLRAAARAAGFELVGIATLGPAATGAAYLRWLERGDQAGMDWMARSRAVRLDPRRLLPGARSALVVGLRYAPHAAQPPAGSIWPRVARYARGSDYHGVVRQRLRRVERALRAERPEAGTRICVDTAPLLERELAARAGLGAVGKNTLLLHPEAGSWFVLGELLTTLDLAPDVPLADLCGDCRRCLDACPTGALPEPYRLDARRCLAYWTIEHRGEIAEPYRAHLAERLFGCDACQEACPWNRRALPPVVDPELGVVPERAALDLAGLLGISAARYRRELRATALERARREGLRRNAAYALAAAAGGAAGAALERAAEGDGPAAAAARWARARRPPGGDPGV
jgi:epoxyqueuosine reductase